MADFGSDTDSNASTQPDTDPDTESPSIPEPGPNAIQWRRDASTTRSVRLCWSLGVGTFFATITIVVFWRFFDIAGQVGAEAIVAALFVALGGTILALAFLGDPNRNVTRLMNALPIETPELGGGKLERAVDAAVGSVVMGGVMVVLMATGRIVSQYELLALGAGPFTLLAAGLIPLALVSLVAASFLRSVGTFDPDAELIYLHDPNEVVDLEYIVDASTRTFGDAVILTLTYAQPDGTYVPGPRRLVVPPEIAAKIHSAIRAR